MSGVHIPNLYYLKIAMKTKSGLILAAILATQTIPAFAQYHYSYGDSRVTNQHQTGLYNPSSTYLGAGTLSQSAQGKAAGIGGALPSVNMGAHVRTPGDNMYNNDGTDRMYNGAFIYEDQKQQILRTKAMKIQRQRMLMQQQQRQQQVQPGYVYMPGSNGASANYGSQATHQIQYNRNGNATYGDSYTGKSAVRQF